MSNPNFPTQAQNDAKYATPANVASAISTQATTDAGQYESLLKTITVATTPSAPIMGQLVSYNASNTGYRTDSVTLTVGSSTIPDTAVTTSDLGRPVIGTQIPAGSYVGTVTAGTSFVLVNASGTAVNVVSASSPANFITLGPLFNPALPTLSTVTVGAQYYVQKSEADTSANPINITASGSDTFDSGSSSLQLRTTGEVRLIQAILISGTKYWKVASGANIVTSNDNRYAPKLIKNNVVSFLGDSITGLNGTGDNVATYHGSNDNFTHLTTWLSGGRLTFGGAYSNGGFTASQIRDIVLPRLLAKPGGELPGTVVMLAGTNDVGQSIPTATTMQAFSDIYNALRQRGMTLVCATIPPRGDSTVPNALVGPLNMAIRNFAQSNGLDCLPLHEALVNAPDGKYISGYAIADNIHPSRLGMIAIAQNIVSSGFINRFPVRSSITAKSAADGSNLMGAYGHFLTDANSDGVADGWATGGSNTWTPSLLAPSAGDNLAGNWQRAVITSSATGSGRYLQYGASATLSTSNDLFECTGRIRITGATAGLVTGSGIAVQFQPSGGTGVADATIQGSSVDITDGTFTIRQRISSAYTAWKITIGYQTPSTGTLTVDFGEVTVRNLTALGLA